MAQPLRFTSFDWQRSGDVEIALVTNDSERPREGTFGGLLGATVDIDGGLYVVRDIRARPLRRSVAKGEHLTLKVEKA